MTDNKSLVTSIQSALSIWDTPDPSRVWGLSVSPWSHIVNWQVAKAAGAKFAIIKFMDGKSKVAFAEENYKGAKDAGLLVGGYSWLYRTANISTGTQAREYLAFLKDHPCDIRPSVDFEWTNWSGAPSNPNWNDLYGFVIPFEDGYGKKPMIYTAPGYWNEYGSQQAVWADYPMWGAQYRTSVYKPFGPWKDNYKIWQFSAVGNGALYGYPKDGEKEAELNYWPGTLADLYAWCASSPSPPPPVPPAPGTRTIDNVVVDCKNNSLTVSWSDDTREMLLP